MSKQEINNDESEKCRNPVIFEYAYPQKPGGFEDIFYDYVEDLNLIHGKTVVECSKAESILLTKTKAERESDDDSNELLMNSVTKTNTQREVDDAHCDELMYATTKTFVERESDDTPTPYMLLLTKTEQAREADE